ncbi:response regulator [bacterium]|nr:response regulator [bacterium]
MGEKIKRPYILIVDDDPKIHKLLEKMLESEGFEIGSAFNAKQAFEAVRVRKHDVMLLDIMMPEVSGIEVVNKIRADKDLKDIIVLVISAKDHQNDRIEGLSHGADDYISKPFHLKSLVRKIDHMLAERK